MAQIRAEGVGVIFQDPLSSLNPCFSVGDQVAEILRVHRGLSRRAARDRAVELLDLVDIREPARRARQYPHEMSGGMRQRVMIAMAISLEPPLLLADEPTTALDTSVRGSILRTIQEMRDRLGMGVLLITHDVGVAAAVADRVAVMYAGRIVEYGTAEQVLRSPRHPYTAALLASMPRLGHPDEELYALAGTPPTLRSMPPGCAFAPRCPIARDTCRTTVPPLVEVTDPTASRQPGTSPRASTRRRWSVMMSSQVEPTAVAVPERAPREPLVVVEHLVKEYPIGKGRRREIFRAVDDVSFSIPAGGTLGVVGESGSGKSTTAMIVAGLTRRTSGAVRIDGTDVGDLDRAGLRALRKDVQVVFQDPHSSLDPRMSVAQAIAEPLHVHRVGGRGQRRDRVAELLELVGLHADYADRHPHQLSGGQAQRVSIARALALEPRLLILDEPVSALDLSIQAQVLNLLRRLQRDLGLSYLFIGHDLAAVAYVSDLVAVMHRGRIVEQGAVAAVYENPREDYTRMLLDAILTPEDHLGALNSAPRWTRA